MKRTERIYEAMIRLFSRHDGFYTLAQFEARMKRLEKISLENL